MYKNIENVNIYYEDINKEAKNTLVLLHGWGQNIEMMKPISNNLKQYRIILIDLPGHGKSEEPMYPFTVSDYVEMVYKLLKELKIKNPTLIGHSFGGKISLLYASKYSVKKLILFGSPFKKEITKESFKLKTLKALKKIPGINKLEGFAKRHIGSTDYKNASAIMRQILVNTVNDDITKDISKINCSTLLIWGTRDEAVDLSQAYELNELIEDSAVIEYENCTHYAYLENIGQTVNIIKNFTKE